MSTNHLLKTLQGNNVRNFRTRNWDAEFITPQNLEMEYPRARQEKAAVLRGN